jgi:hypothetical protein
MDRGQNTSEYRSLADCVILCDVYFDSVQVRSCPMLPLPLPASRLTVALHVSNVALVSLDAKGSCINKIQAISVNHAMIRSVDHHPLQLLTTLHLLPSDVVFPLTPVSLPHTHL